MIFSLVLVGVSSQMFAEMEKKNCNPKSYKQWFTGPLFTPNAITLEPGHPGIEPIVIFTNFYGKYDANGHLRHTPKMTNILPCVDCQGGITERIGVEVIAFVAQNFSRNVSSTNFKDSILRVGYQISNDIKHTWIPDFRIVVQETLPTGKYQKLKLQKFGTDCSGQGVFQTGLYLVTQKLFFADSCHPLRLRGVAGYFFQSSRKVKGLNFYGGGINTNGIVHPGNYMTFFLLSEYALTRKWALACELNYQRGKAGRYSWKSGQQCALPSYNQFTIYPEIQHTLSKNTALVFGGAFTASGKNSNAYYSLAWAYLYIF